MMTLIASTALHNWPIETHTLVYEEARPPYFQDRQGSQPSFTGLPLQVATVHTLNTGINYFQS